MSDPAETSALLTKDTDVSEVEAAVQTIPPALFQQVTEVLESDTPEDVTALVEPLHAGEVSALLGQLSSGQRVRLAEILGSQLPPEVFLHISREVSEDIADALGTYSRAAAIVQLDTDDAVQAIEVLPPDAQEALLAAIPASQRAPLEEGLSYPESSAGRLMDPHYVAVPEFWSVGDTIDFMRSENGLPGDFYGIVVLDPKYRPLGMVRLSRVMTHQRDVAMTALMEDEFRTIPTDMDQEDVAHLFRTYGLTSATVVGEGGKLVGMITLDDIMAVVREEDEEDILRMGGVIGDHIHMPPWRIVRRRFPWLFINLFTAIAASVVIALFEETIARAVALAVLMPIVASMGGNAGIQTVTVAVRALAQKQLTRHNALRILAKEALVGGLNGVLFAGVCGGLVYGLYGESTLALAFAGATLITLLLAGFAGMAIPLGLVRMGADPAVASGVFLTTVTDMAGFFAFLGLAAWILP